MKVMAVDIGGTNTKCVIMDADKIAAAYALEGNAPEIVEECAKRCMAKAGVGKTDIGRVAVTGGFGRKIKKRILGMEFEFADEIESIGRGAMHLFKSSFLFVANIGTGTSFLVVKNGVCRHIGGSGIGGGTFKGISYAMIGKGPDETEELAAKGKRENIDITVFDIMGRGISEIPEDATASNMGKIRQDSAKEDKALGITNMIAESLGVMIYYAALANGLERSIALCGRVSQNKLICRRLQETIELFGGKAKSSEMAQYCTAIGAALLCKI